MDLSLTGALAPGEWALVLHGVAREALTPDMAAEIARALAGLLAALDGGDLGDAFADLERRGPPAPPLAV